MASSSVDRFHVASASVKVILPEIALSNPIHVSSSSPSARHGAAARLLGIARRVLGLTGSTGGESAVLEGQANETHFDLDARPPPHIASVLSFVSSWFVFNCHI